MQESAPALRELLGPGTLTRRRAAIIAAIGYGAAALIVRVSLLLAEALRGYDDARDQDVSQIFLFFTLLFFTQTVWAIYRRPKLSKV